MVEVDSNEENGVSLEYWWRTPQLDSGWYEPKLSAKEFHRDRGGFRVELRNSFWGGAEMLQSVRGRRASALFNPWTLAARVLAATRMVQGSIEVDPLVCSGKPVLVGTRFPLARVFAELAEGHRLGEIAEDYDLDVSALESAFEGLAIFLDQDG